MAKARVVVKVSPKKSKGGTIIALQAAELRKSKKVGGKPMWQTRAQLLVRLQSDGQPRARSR